VTDGVRWAIGDGVADANRICIYGGSYGAYSALTGAFREPGMFKCAVGMAGVYDLALMFQKGDIPTFTRGLNYLKDALGEDRDELRGRSPAHNAKAITAKVLLVHGKEDPRAPLVQAERMRKALVQAGNPPEWVTETGESHGIFNPQNRVETWNRILAFFERNVGH
jgi:dipeptidyl aminopeptidase/acylaminoacyl peptidase